MSSIHTRLFASYQPISACNKPYRLLLSHWSELGEEHRDTTHYLHPATGALPGNLPSITRRVQAICFLLIFGTRLSPWSRPVRFHRVIRRPKLPASVFSFCVLQTRALRSTVLATAHSCVANQEFPLVLSAGHALPWPAIAIAIATCIGCLRLDYYLLPLGSFVCPPLRPPNRSALVTQDNQPFCVLPVPPRFWCRRPLSVLTCRKSRLGTSCVP